MSTNNEFVSKTEFMERLDVIAGFMESMAKMVDQAEKQRVGELNTITNINSRLETIENTVQQLVTALTQAQQPQQQEQAPAAPPMRQKLDMSELIEGIKAAASAYKDVKMAAYGETTELDKWGMAAAEVAKREAINAMKLQVRRGLRSRVVDAGTVENIVGETIEAASTGGANHKPIL